MAHATAHPKGLDALLADTLATLQPIERKPARYLDSDMTFEQWMRRPVYVAHCKTAAVARAMGVICFRFRCLPAYRDEQAKRARKLVADMMRKERQRIAL